MVFCARLLIVFTKGLLKYARLDREEGRKGREKQKDEYLFLGDFLGFLGGLLNTGESLLPQNKNEQ